jgi:hypothetical protein
MSEPGTPGSDDSEPTAKRAVPAADDAAPAAASAVAAEPGTAGASAQPVGTGWIRALTTVVLLAVACPAALFGGSMLGCVGEGFNASCAMDAIFVSPILLFVAGAITGLLVRGWSGVFLMVFGVVVGMFVLLGVSFGIGRPVPVDPISGVIATLWFLAPVSAGYFVGRMLWHLWHHFDAGESKAS